MRREAEWELWRRDLPIPVLGSEENHTNTRGLVPQGKASAKSQLLLLVIILLDLDTISVLALKC